jgi:hypothetical protein
MVKEDNKDISRRFLEVLWNEKNDSIIDELIADAYIDHTTPCSPDFRELEGPEVFKEVFDALQGDFFDIRVSIEDQIAEDDKVVNLVAWQYTLRSDNDPAIASQVVTITGIGIDRIDGSKIVESWNTFDVTYRLLNALEMACPLRRKPGPGGVDCNNDCPKGFRCEGRCVRG